MTTYNLHELATSTIDADCSNLRDRVYCLLSIVSVAESSLIRPDHRMPISGVFATATFASIAGTGGLEILSEARADRERSLDLPTWAANFARLGGVGSERRIYHRCRGPDKPWNLICALGANYLPAANGQLSEDRRFTRLDGLIFDKVGALLPEAKFA